MTSHFTLWGCLYLKDDSTSKTKLFQFTAPVDARVFYLQKFVCEMFKNALRTVDPDELKLWKLNNPIPYLPRRGVAEFIRTSGDAFADHAEELDEPGEIVSQIFQNPAADRLHLIVQAPASATISPSNSNESNLTVERGKLPQLQKVSSSHPLHKLWTRCREPETTLFKLHQVQRDESHPSNSIDVPSSCLLLEVQDWIGEFQPDSSFSGVLVREEYEQALRALMKWFLEGKDDITTGVAVGEDAMQVDDVLPALLPNPFFALSPDSRPKDGPFVLLDHPGIGKTVFLYVLLVLRLQAGLPTLYQSRKTLLYYFDETGVSLLDLTGLLSPTNFRAQISPYTWCLIDSNQELISVPLFIQDLHLFIVQSSSPRWDHLEWTKKHLHTTKWYFLKPWTLSKLFVGRSLQHTTCSERDTEPGLRNNNR